MIGHRRRSTVVAVCLAALAVVAYNVASAPPASDLTSLPAREVVHQGEPSGLRVAVAGSNREHATGLSGIDRLPDGLDGMWFAFGEQVDHPFWMRDTRFALDLYWLADDGEVLGVVTMEPCGDHAGCPDHHPPGPYHAVLELPAGTANVGVGDQVTLASTGHG